MDVVVFGNATLDVICQTIDEVPRNTSIRFERAEVSPGGCGSNVAVGLRALGVSTALVACVGDDDASYLVERYWQRIGIDCRFVRRVEGMTTGISIGLVDSHAQPRFIHTPGANATLRSRDLDPARLVEDGARYLIVAGFFILPGLLDGELPGVLAYARRLGLHITLDVTLSPAMDDPSYLWPCLGELDIFLCNLAEARRITGVQSIQGAANFLIEKGCRIAIIKLGEQGCWVESEGYCGQVYPPSVPVVDTTGAGDAFAAGLVAALARGDSLEAAVKAANQAGSRQVSSIGAISGWSQPVS